MEPLIHDDFLLGTDSARALYEEYARPLPLIDYHTHLSPQEIAGDRRWENLAQLWLGGDHYKWRALRWNGVPERLVTGDAPDREKFNAFASTLPRLLRNPLHHWCHLELARYFDYYGLLGPTPLRGLGPTPRKSSTTASVARECLRSMRVQVVCTTDDPADDLAYHKKVKDEGFACKVLPTWRPDKAMAIENPEAYNAYLAKLGELANVEISSFAKLIEALKVRHNFFHEMGCRLSDRGLECFWPKIIPRPE
ncbi:MAG: glucuronate isomerase [Bdellovibrionaceae bacterium]|nr:glucuronate isomerase [Pseudobdellovibrionaceae bacterium]